MKGEEGVWGASPPVAPPEANEMKRSQIKWKLLLFDESDFFLLRPVYFYSLLIGPRYLFSRKSRNMYFLKKQTNQIIK